MKERNNLLPLTIIFLWMACVCVYASSPTIKFQHLASSYTIDQTILPLYQISTPNLHGSINLIFEDLEGSYALTGISNYIFDYPPFDANKYLASLIYSIDVSNVTIVSGKTDGRVKVVLHRALMKNINPYDMELIGIAFTRPFVKQEDLLSNNTGLYNLENTFEVSFKSVQSKQRNYIAFQYYVKGTAQEPFGRGIQISYPRDIRSDLYYYRSKLFLDVAYDTAPVVDPSNINSSPTVSFSNGFVGIRVPQPYTYNLFTVDVAVKSVSTPLDERIQITFEYSKTNGLIPHSGDAFKIDPLSVVCAFEDAITGIVVDEGSQVLEVSSQNSQNSNQLFILECSERQLKRSYSLYMLAKQADDRYPYDCKFGIANSLGSSIILSYSIKNGEQTDQLLTKTELKSALEGKLTVNNQDLSLYSKVSPPNTIQKPLSLKLVFSIEFTTEHVDKSNNLIYFEYTNSLQPYVDPFSTRVTIYNEATNSFELYQQPDVPKLGEAKWSFNALNTSKIVIGLWVYDKNTAELGEPVFVNYPRNIHYTLEQSLDLTVYFKTGTEIQTKPFYVLDNFDGDLTNLMDGQSYNILKSLKLNYYQGLEILNFDEGRIFKFLPSTTFNDKKGNPISVKFDEMTCAYLIKDSVTGNYSSVEYSDAIPIYAEDPVDQTWKYSLDCSEDIRETEFLVLLVAKQFQRTEENINFGSSVNINPLVLSNYLSSWSEKDALQVYFNPNSALKGRFTLYNKDVSQFTDYNMPHTLQQPLTVLGVFELDHNAIATNNLHDFNQISVQFIKGSSIFNMDPKSFRLFKVYTKLKFFEPLFEDSPFEGPWKFKIDPTDQDPFTFAICAFEGSSANFGQDYQISYSRLLQFSLENLKLSYSFQLTSGNTLEPSFKLLNNESGQVIIDPISKAEYYSIHSFEITQNLLSFGVKSWREFQISSLNTNLDNSTISCAFSLGNDNLHISTEKAIFKDGFFFLKCEENIMVNTYEMYLVAKKKFVPPVPIPSPSPSPVPPTPVPSPSRSQPRPTPTPIPSHILPSPKPTPSPQPTPLNSFERENGIPLVQDSTISKSIKTGESILYQITVSSYSSLTISCSTLFGIDITLLIGQNFKPSIQKYSLKMNSNHIRSIDNSSPNSQTYYIEIEGPIAGHTNFALLPSITPLKVSSSRQPIIPQQNNVIGFVIAIIILSLFLIGTLVFFLGCCVYWTKKNRQNSSQHESTGLIRKGFPNTNQLEASYYSEENL